MILAYLDVLDPFWRENCYYVFPPPACRIEGQQCKHELGTRQTTGSKKLMTENFYFFYPSNYIFLQSLKSSLMLYLLEA